MNEIVLLVLFLILGYAAGIFVGMLGIGGGIFFVPLLYLLLPFTKIDISQISYLAIGTSLFAGSFAAISSGTRHYIKNNVDLKKSLLLSFGSIISAYYTPFYVISVKPFYLQIIIAIVFSIIAVKMLLENGYGEVKLVKKPINEYYLILFGLLIGILAAFAGVGGGILFVPILIYFYFVDIKKAIGTSSVATAFTMIASAISYTIQKNNGITIPYQIGYIYLLAGIPLGIGSSLGALLGVKIVLASKVKTIKKIFSILLIIVVIKIIFDL